MSSRPYQVQNKAIRRSFGYAILATSVIGLGLYLDFDPLIGIGLGGLFVALLFAFVLWAIRRVHRKLLDPMIEGQRYVHWTYPPEDWLAHLQGEKKRVPHEFLRYIYAGLGLGGILALLIFSSAYWLEKLSLWESAFPASLFGIGFFTLCFIIGLFAELFRYLRLRELGRLGGEIYIGPNGLFYSGKFYLRGQYRWLKWVKGENGEGLLFHFQMPLRYGNTYPEEVLIPVPRGREKEALAILPRVAQDWGGQVTGP